MSSRNAGPSHAIAESELFVGLEPLDLAEVARIAQPLQYAAGARIFELGQHTSRMLLVESGTVRLALPLMVRGSPQEVTLDEKTSGAVIAWSALVPPHTLMLSAIAATDVVLVALERLALEGLFRTNRRIQTAVLSNLNRVISGRVAMLEALVISELQRWVADRFA